MNISSFDADVLVIGSGFGGSVAALRFSEAGERVMVLERGDWVSREDFEPDLDMFWIPKLGRYGMNELRPRGRNVIPWLAAAVGGGSHVYAATLKRREFFDDFPEAIRNDDLTPYYERAEEMLDAQLYPDYPPYGDIRAVKLLCQAEETVAEENPERVEHFGRINLGISFAPPDGKPGAAFTNKHGAPQRYSDPSEQKVLGGDIEAKNSLDRNYLFLAQKHGAEIRALCQADRIEPLEGGGWRVHIRQRGMDAEGGAEEHAGSVTARRLVLAAGSIGSTELLLRNRDVHGTLDRLSPALGTRYTSNGDYVSMMLSTRGLGLSWGGLAAVTVGLVIRNWGIAAVGAALYAIGLIRSRSEIDPDIGTTNSDYIRFRHRDGSQQGVYIEGGRYPTPIRFFLSFLLSSLGLWRPGTYRKIVRFTNGLERLVPPFELLARSWPVPLLQMGRDDAVGTFELDDVGRAVIDYPLEDNMAYYDDLDRLGRLIAQAVDMRYIPNFIARRLKRIEVPHNLGGVPMGDNAETGVVDHAGRVFGYDDFFVLDGSIIPVTLGPNPSLTILALAERAMDMIRA